MDFIQVLKVVWLGVTIVVLVFFGIRTLIQIKRNEMVAPSFKQLLQYLLTCCLLSDTFSLFNLLLSMASGKWPLGFVACEFWGFLTTVISVLCAWILTITMVERYVAILTPVDLLSTFTARNIRITVVGLVLLILMASTGPFYGFGEFTYLRGYLNVFVSTNISLPDILPKDIHPEVKLESLHQLFSHLKRTSDISPRMNILHVLSRHLHDHYDVIVSRAHWLTHGIQFYIRALSMTSLNRFTQHCRDKIFATNLTELSFLEDIATTLNISDAEITVQISDEELYLYRETHLPAQDIGMCTADLTTPNHHSSVWTGYYMSIVFILPYCTSLIGLCLIYIRGFGYNSMAIKQASDRDVAFTNVISSFCMTTCIIYLFYYATTLASADGESLSTSVLLLTNYLASLKTVYLVIIMRCSSYACTCYCTCCYNCFRRINRWNNSDGLTFELHDLEASQSLTGKMNKNSILS